MVVITLTLVLRKKELFNQKYLVKKYLVKKYLAKEVFSMKNLIAEEKMEEMLKSIESGIMTVSKSSNFREFLKFQSKNYSHSIKNIILANQQYIQLQLDNGGISPLRTAGIFKGQDQWNEIGREVNPGEVPLEIFSPIIKKKLVRDKEVAYINYKSLNVGSNVTATIILRDIIYSGKGLYVYMFEIIDFSGKEIQGILRATSKTALEFRKIYKVQGMIEQFKSIKQLAIKKIIDEMELDIQETSYCAGFKLTPVFSQHQTNGKDIPTICNRLVGESDQAADLEKIIKKIIDIPITYERARSNGYYVPSDKIININPELLEEKYICQRVKTLIHEYAHYLVDSMGYVEKIQDIAEENQGEAYALEELVAESVAFMVCNIHNVDTSNYSFEYIASWSCTNVEAFKKMFEIIQRIYTKVIKNIIKENELEGSVFS